jgi:hypothetical protein
MITRTAYLGFLLCAFLLSACDAPPALPVVAGDTPPAAQTTPAPTSAPTAVVLVAMDAPAPTAAPTLTAPSLFPTPPPPDDCPITPPPDPAFVPPEPYAHTAPYGEFWYGTNDLWTMLPPDGRWYDLPLSKDGYAQKVFWWREGYDMRTEQQPQITMSGRRLDGDAPAFEHTGGTNGYHADMGEFMLTGVIIPTTGCWEITGRYGAAELSFVVWVAP